MSDRPVIAISDITDLDPAPAIAAFEEAGFQVELLDLGSGRAPSGAAFEAVGLLCGYAAIDRTLIGRLTRLEVIATSSTGTDMVDVVAAGERGITVLPLLDASTREVATHALALILANVRHLDEAGALVRGGGWTVDFPVVPRAVEGLTLGLVGFGRIARELARIAAPLVGRIVAFDPAVAGADVPVELVPMERLLAESDVVSLHVPLVPGTSRMVDAAFLSAMRPLSLLVNVSRGELVSPEAVLAALDDGSLAAYAADVLEGEPPASDDPLRTHGRAFVTPHIGFLSERSLERYTIGPARALIRFLTSGSAEGDGPRATTGFSKGTS